MRPDGVVVDAPRLDDPPDLGEGGEDALVQALVAQLAVEAFDEGVLHRLARRDVVSLDALPGRPAQHGLAIAVTHSRSRIILSPGRQKVRHRRQAPAVEVVDYVEEAKPPAVGKLVADEVERPTLVRAPLNSSTAPAHALEARHNGQDRNDPMDVRDQISSSGHTGRRTFLNGYLFQSNEVMPPESTYISRRLIFSKSARK